MLRSRVFITLKIHQSRKHNRSIRSVQSRPCAAYAPPLPSHNAEEPRSGYVLKFGPLDCSPGLSGKRRGGERRRKGEEMMEGRPTIRVCFLACWGLQPNLLHLLANACRRVICRAGGSGEGGVIWCGTCIRPKCQMGSLHFVKISPRLFRTQ